MATHGTRLAVLDTAATRVAEAAAGIKSVELMERAGMLAARAVLTVIAPRSAVVVCGTGNNGGDGYVVARHLAQAGVTTVVAATGDPATPAAAAMRARWTGPVVALATAAPAAVLVDAVVGTGCTRPLAAPVVIALARLATGAVVVALDLPSGLNADDGRGEVVNADLTIAFGTLKPAHLLSAERCGRVVVADLGFDTSGATLFATTTPPPLTPPRDAHKYSRGAVLAIGGGPGRGGAARLAAAAAVRAGAGLALVAVPPAALTENAARLDAVMVRAAGDEASIVQLLHEHRFAAAVAGPGLTVADNDRVAALLASGLPLVLDGGVFTQFAGDPARLAAALIGPVVLTPHRGEFARLFGDGDFGIAAVRAAARATGAVVLLKGPATIIAAPDGRAAVNAHATPWLATAGSGDVLAGVIAALLAQGFMPFDAACAGAWLHGEAGRRCGAGLTADDLAAAIGRSVAAL